MTLAIIYREELKEYDFGPGHPFRGDRYEIFPPFLMQHLEQDDNYRFLQSEWAGDDDLLRICDPDYIDFTREFFRAAHAGLSYPGRFYQYHSADNMPIGRPGQLEEAARLVIGQAKLAADLVQSGQFNKVVSLGGGLHHARRGYGEGFCLYNDVAFCATYLLEEYNLERILVLDTDAHAGNGTSEYFYSSPQVLFIDLHQDPRTLYPGVGFASDTGIGDGRGFTVNVPMPVYSGNDSYRLVFDEIVEPLAEEFQPQIIIRNGGSDPHFNDGLTRLGLTVAGFEMIGRRVRKMTGICQGRLIDLIASGYNREILPCAWLALIAGLADFKVSIDEPEPVPALLQNDPSFQETTEVVAEVRSYLKDYWRCL